MYVSRFWLALLYAQSGVAFMLAGAHVIQTQPSDELKIWVCFVAWLGWWMAAIVQCFLPNRPPATRRWS